MYDDIIGNDHIKEYLARVVDRGMVGNSWLFAGPVGVGKGLFAEALSRALICGDDPDGVHRCKMDTGNHPDIRVYRPEGKSGMHAMASMRQFSEEVYQSPFEAAWKVFIVHDAERMLPTSANALLKTFEEPATTSVIILLSSVPELFLPTILSRCRKVCFQPVAEEKIGVFLQQQYEISEEQASLWAALARGSVGRAVQLAKQGSDPIRDMLLRLLSYGRVTDYRHLAEVAKQLSAHLDEVKETVGASLREELVTDAFKELPATQQEAVTKEIDGAVSIRFLAGVDALLDVILSWYRDLQLVYVNGDRSQLVHRDQSSALERVLQRGLMLPLEKVQQAIKETRLAVSRSLPLNTCLESLFLKLDLM